MSVGFITREAVHEALKQGITAMQIIHFLQVCVEELEKRKLQQLRSFPSTSHKKIYIFNFYFFFCHQVHSHAQMKDNRSRFSPLPPTVSDQILLWEKERSRSVFDSSFFFPLKKKLSAFPLVSFLFLISQKLLSAHKTEWKPDQAFSTSISRLLITLRLGWKEKKTN